MKNGIDRIDISERRQNAGGEQKLEDGTSTIKNRMRAARVAGVSQQKPHGSRIFR